MSKDEKCKIKKYQRNRLQQLIQYKNEVLQSKLICFTNYKNDKRTLKFRNIKVNKTFLKSKKSINLDLLNVDQIVISVKFKYYHDGFKYFIGYKEDDILKSLSVILHQMIHT